MKKMFRSKWSMITYILSFCFLFVGTSLVFASWPVQSLGYIYLYFDVNNDGICDDNWYDDEANPGGELYTMQECDQSGEAYPSLASGTKNVIIQALQNNGIYDYTAGGIDYTFQGFQDSTGELWYDRSMQYVYTGGYSYVTTVWSGSYELYPLWDEYDPGSDEDEWLYIECYDDDEWIGCYDGSIYDFSGRIDSITKEGYIFLGWYEECDENGNGTGDQWFDQDGYLMPGKRVSAGDSFSVYAGWKEDGYVITFDNQDGTSTTMTVNAGDYFPDAVDIPTNADYEEYVFYGYFADTTMFSTQYYDECGDVTYEFSNEEVTSDITLYAYWLTEFVDFYDWDGNLYASIPYDSAADEGMFVLPNDWFTPGYNYKKQAVVGIYFEDGTQVYNQSCQLNESFYDENGICSILNLEYTDLYVKLVSNLWTDYAVAPESGTGTESNPYIIDSAENLAWIASQTNSGAKYNGKDVASSYFFQSQVHIDLGSRYIEEYDVTINPYWVPIGTEDNPFKGDFLVSLNNEGRREYTIQNMTTISTKYVGLFGYCVNAYIQRVGLTNANIQVSIQDAYVGGVLGYGDSCYISANGVTYSTITARVSKYVGCVVGYATRVGLVSAHHCALVVASCEYVGGAVGASGDVSNSGSFQDSSITATNCQYVGGIVGEGNVKYGSSRTEVSGCTITVAAEQENDLTEMYIGGIAGKGEVISADVIGSTMDVEVSYHIEGLLVNAFAGQNVYLINIGGVVGYGNTVNCKSGGVVDSDKVTMTVNTTISESNNTATSGFHSDLYANVGGVVGFGTAESSTAEKLTLNYTAINTSESENVGVASCAGGIIGQNYYEKSKANIIPNCTLKDSNITANAVNTLGGIVGKFSQNTYGTDYNLQILNCYVINGCSISTESCLNVGGIVGTYNQNGLTDYAMYIKNCIVSDADIQGKKYVGAVVGTAGCCNIISCQVNSVALKGEIVGGLIGVMWDEHTLEREIENCVVVNIDVATDSLIQAGGFVGTQGLSARGGFEVKSCLYMMGDNSPQTLFGQDFGAFVCDTVIRIESSAALDTSEIVEKNIAHFAEVGPENNTGCLIFENANGCNLYYTGSGDWESSSIKIVNDKPLPACLWIAAGGEDVTTAKLANLGYQVYSA